MIKNDLVEELMEKDDLSRAFAEDVVDHVVEGIQGALRRGEKVTFRGIGIFSVVETKPRMGRNPKTGEPVKIPARKKVKFRVAKGLLR
jgi:nucleoid DNA-binding protein